MFVQGLKRRFLKIGEFKQYFIKMWIRFKDQKDIFKKYFIL